MKELLEFEELRGDKDINYWINYNIKFGNSHLINPTHNMSYTQIYDLDIKAAILLTLFMTYQTAKMLICGRNN